METRGRWIGSRALWLVVSVIVLSVITGCESFQRSEAAARPAVSSTPTNAAAAAVRNNTASLLYDLLGDEKNVSKLLIIKRDRRELHDVIKRISVASGKAREEMETLARDDRTFDLKQTSLPPGEKAARESISSARTKELLHASGPELEFRLLLTQVEALGYAENLAVVAARNESSAKRAEFFSRLGNEMKTLRTDVIALMRTPVAVNPK
jgi:hypothetical protein